MSTTTGRSAQSTRTTFAWNRTSTTSGREPAMVTPPAAGKAFKPTSTTANGSKRPKGSSAPGGMGSRRPVDDDEATGLLGPWLPGYRPLDPPDFGDGPPPPERPEGQPTGSAIVDQDGAGPDLTSPLMAVAAVPLSLALTGAWTAFTRRRRRRS